MPEPRQTHLRYTCFHAKHRNRDATKQTRDDEAEKLLAYCFSHSLFIVQSSSPLKDFLCTHVAHAPITCAPFPFPRNAFQDALNLMPAFNNLCIEIPTKNWFWDVTQRVAAQDVFIGSLLKCLNPQNRFEFCVQRSDYMLDRSGSIKQVELNTIAAALYGMAPRVTRLHRRRLDTRSSVPENNVLKNIVRGFRKADKLYRDAFKVRDTVILMVIQEEERNIFDQSAFIDAVGLPVIRRTLSELAALAEDHHLDQPLMVDGKEVSIVYYRAGYTPRDYTNSTCWKIRGNIELSRAIKCPSIRTQLVGMKKMQQVLAEPEIIAELGIHKLSECFVEFYDVNDLPKLDVNNLVVKPQREGGGNNYYSSDIPSIVPQLASSPDAYVIMQRIDSPPQNVRALSNGRIIELSAVTELGIFGVVIADKQRILWNKTAGYVLRTKSVDSHEGGFMRGVSFVDAPLLI